MRLLPSLMLLFLTGKHSNINKMQKDLGNSISQIAVKLEYVVVKVQKFIKSLIETLCYEKRHHYLFQQFQANLCLKGLRKMPPDVDIPVG